MGLPRSVEDSTYEKSKNKKKKKKEREKKEERYPRRSWQSLGIAVRRRPTTPQKRLPLSLIRLPTLPPSFFSLSFSFSSMTVLFDPSEKTALRALRLLPTPVFLLAVDLTAAPATTSPRFDERRANFFPSTCPPKPEETVFPLGERASLLDKLEILCCDPALGDARF